MVGSIDKENDIVARAKLEAKKRFNADIPETERQTWIEEKVKDDYDRLMNRLASTFHSDIAHLGPFQIGFADHYFQPDLWESEKVDPQTLVAGRILADVLPGLIENSVTERSERAVQVLVQAIDDQKPFHSNFFEAIRILSENLQVLEGADKVLSHLFAPKIGAFSLLRRRTTSDHTTWQNGNASAYHSQAQPDQLVYHWNQPTTFENRPQSPSTAPVSSATSAQHFDEPGHDHIHGSPQTFYSDNVHSSQSHSMSQPLYPPNFYQQPVPQLNARLPSSETTFSSSEVQSTVAADASNHDQPYKSNGLGGKDQRVDKNGQTIPVDEDEPRHASSEDEVAPALSSPGSDVNDSTIIVRQRQVPLPASNDTTMSELKDTENKASNPVTSGQIAGSENVSNSVREGFSTDLNTSEEDAWRNRSDSPEPTNLAGGKPNVDVFPIPFRSEPSSRRGSRRQSKAAPESQKASHPHDNAERRSKSPRNSSKRRETRLNSIENKIDRISPSTPEPGPRDSQRSTRSSAKPTRTQLENETLPIPTADEDQANSEQAPPQRNSGSEIVQDEVPQIRSSRRERKPTQKALAMSEATLRRKRSASPTSSPPPSKAARSSGPGRRRQSALATSEPVPSEIQVADQVTGDKPSNGSFNSSPQQTVTAESRDMAESRASDRKSDSTSRLSIIAKTSGHDQDLEISSQDPQYPEQPKHMETEDVRAQTRSRSQADQSAFLAARNAEITTASSIEIASSRTRSVSSFPADDRSRDNSASKRQSTRRGSGLQWQKSVSRLEPSKQSEKSVGPEDEEQHRKLVTGIDSLHEDSNGFMAYSGPNAHESPTAAIDSSLLVWASIAAEWPDSNDDEEDERVYQQNVINALRDYGERRAPAQPPMDTPPRDMTPRRFDVRPPVQPTLIPSPSQMIYQGVHGFPASPYAPFSQHRSGPAPQILPRRWSEDPTLHGHELPPAPSQWSMPPPPSMIPPPPPPLLPRTSIQSSYPIHRSLLSPSASTPRPRVQEISDKYTTLIQARNAARARDIPINDGMGWEEIQRMVEEYDARIQTNINRATRPSIPAPTTPIPPNPFNKALRQHDVNTHPFRHLPAFQSPSISGWPPPPPVRPASNTPVDARLQAAPPRAVKISGPRSTSGGFVPLAPAPPHKPPPFTGMYQDIRVAGPTPLKGPLNELRIARVETPQSKSMNRQIKPSWANAHAKGGGSRYRIDPRGLNGETPGGGTIINAKETQEAAKERIKQRSASVGGSSGRASPATSTALFKKGGELMNFGEK